VDSKREDWATNPTGMYAECTMTMKSLKASELFKSYHHEARYT